MKLLRRRPRTEGGGPAAPAPAVDPRDLCQVLTCRRPWTVPHAGYGLCAEHDAARNQARVLAS